MTLALVLLSASLAASPVAPTPADRFSGFPRLNQLAASTRSGHADPNAQMNCIPTAMAAGLQFLTGRAFDGDMIKDAIYGADYVGPTQIIKYRAFTRDQGVALDVFTSRNSEVLVTELRRLLSQGEPVVLTLPGNLDQPPADLLHPKQLTHVVVAAGFDQAGNIRVMNPWGGVWVAGNDAYWASRICYGELWGMRKVDRAAPAVATQRRSAPSLDVQPARAGSAGSRPAGRRMTAWSRLLRAPRRKTLRALAIAEPRPRPASF
jgi:hypothetical protein